LDVNEKDMIGKLTVVLTSCGRVDLLKRTIDSFKKFYTISDFIIIEDSGHKDVREELKRLYPDYTLILNKVNLGLFESIDKAYSKVRTPFVVHLEDDWEFFKGGFIERAVKILESDQSIMQVNLSNIQDQPIEGYKFIDGMPYSIFGASSDGDAKSGVWQSYWHGFTCNPSIRSMEGYNKTKPWVHWYDKEDFLALREMRIGQEYYRLGYKAAFLNDSFCTHIGGENSTWVK
jgi:hypothetical protein